MFSIALRQRMRWRLFLAAASILLSSCAGLPAIDRPNFLIVLCDDLGYGDLACYGHPRIETPAVDQLARDGLKLTSCYSAAPNCSPARTGLLTGRTPYRVGIHNWIPFLSPMHVPATERTVATLLREAGYTTCVTGKWHLNGWFNLPGQPQPGEHGFDHWFATQNNALPSHRNPYNFVRNGIPVGPQIGFSAGLVADEAVRWLTEIRDQEKPFFLFVSFHEPHEPIATEDRFSERYRSDDPSLSAHHGNITQMDAALGRLLERLDQDGLRDSTLVFFTSDNGPARTRLHPHGSSGPWREHKGHLYEGGIRVPGIIRWPGRISPGTTSDTPVSAVDVLPTLCELAGISPPLEPLLDGVSLLPLLDGRDLLRSRPLYWQFNYAPSGPDVAIRQGNWKLLATLDLPEFPRGADITPEMMKALKTAEPVAWELYDLGDDPGEQNDRSASEPERLEEMRAVLTGMYHEVREEGPVWPDWVWPRYEGPRIEWPNYRAR